jgi:Uma2 family endonuclease
MSIVSQSAVTQPVTLVPPALALPPVRPEEPTRKRWTREEYYRLAEQGWFQNQRVELIDGEIIQLSPPSPQHAFSSDEIRDLLQQIFGDAYWVRMQLPLSYGDHSEPEPDVSVVRGNRQDHQESHPSTAVLVVEVSRASLDYDKKTKPQLYAAMAIPEYWILDLVHRQLIVHRQPKRDERSSTGSLYASVMILNEEESITSLEKADRPLPISQMLPRKK